MYASGRYGLTELADIMNKKGLRSRRGAKFAVGNFSKLLSNSFYYGLITVRGETFIGKHEPVISKRLFDECRAVAEGRTFVRQPADARSEFLFRRLAHCASCGRALYGERQKGRVYYRCHSGTCKGPAPVGANAGVALPFPGQMRSPMEGSATLTAAQVADLMAGRWYANIHTAANPGGEIRGQMTVR